DYRPGGRAWATGNPLLYAVARRAVLETPRRRHSPARAGNTCSIHLAPPGTHLSSRTCRPSPTVVYWSPDGGQHAAILVVRGRYGWGLPVGAGRADGRRRGARGRLPSMA